MLKSESEMTKTTTKKAASSTTMRKKSASATPSKKGATAAPAPLAATALPEKAASPEKAAARPHPGRAEIARRAYELYLARGGRGGSATEDWLRAERELGNGKGRAQDAAPKK